MFLRTQRRKLSHVLSYQTILHFCSAPLGHASSLHHLGILLSIPWIQDARFGMRGHWKATECQVNFLSVELIKIGNVKSIYLQHSSWLRDGKEHQARNQWIDPTVTEIRLKFGKSDSGSTIPCHSLRLDFWDTISDSGQSKPFRFLKEDFSLILITELWGSRALRTKLLQSSWSMLRWYSHCLGNVLLFILDFHTLDFSRF
jgi:hypothetical protein